MVCHQDIVSSIQLDPEAKCMKEHGNIFLGLDVSSMANRGARLAHLLLLLALISVMCY